MVRFKQRCFRCKKNFVLVSGRQRFVLCYDCQKGSLNVEIKNSKMKKMFNIPEEYYKENYFLRDIKLNYLRFKNLSDKQIEAFKKTVKMMKEEKNA